MEYRTEFLERLARTPASISYRFKRPQGFSFRAGQYMLVNLGEKRVHPLSLSDCPEETGFIEFTKRMTGSPFCQQLEALNRGENIIVKGPAGTFYPDDAGTTVVMIAGGIGITPVRSILKSLEKKRGAHSKIILIYGAKAFYMISGPPAMVEAMKKGLAKIRIPTERIRTDMFFGYD
jgi:ferredoxin-NADP reductase